GSASIPAPGQARAPWGPSDLSEAPMVTSTLGSRHSAIIRRPLPRAELVPTPIRSTALDVVEAPEVPLVDGSRVRYANFDYAASAPCIRAAADAVAELLPRYTA